MLRKIITLLVVFFITIGTISIVNAESTRIFEVPVSQKSDQWKVELGEVKYHSKMSRPKKGENFEMYSLKITNIGKDVHNVEFETYRDEPNSETKFGLSLEDEQKGIFEQGMDVSFANMPIYVKANELEVVISWHGKPVTLKDGTVTEGREYKETFTFTRN
ncbi:hypothetical protein JOC75_003615 [Metabacillus crassostreae]|uniref:hypothetical protein n=1 Tax=Metabacillus crassostreae TaxID=929098 RepID=UPI00195AF2D3|nr:hypothetical protein [Metabacillus crassostreae]MBM7605592.1 hypothetical protein [Metabacillus crassostreae]